jgi:formate-dependent nitrite reductase cytochrome c552 subunit
MRLLGEAANQAQQARVDAARLLGRLGVTAPPRYPDVSTRQKAWDVAQSFVDADGVRLLP